MKLRREVLAFAQLMEAQLRVNDHKGGWKHEPSGYLSRRMGDELREVRAARDAHQREIEKWPYDTADAAALAAAVAGECADLANFAMMLADVVGALRSRP